MTYEYHKQAGSKEVIITLHGTGADEHDLDGLAQAIHPEATIIGLRGDVNEHGMLRWFKRHRPGVFDEEDLKKRAQQLANWLPQLAQKEDFQLQDAIFVGFSNGANMIAALLQRHSTVVKKAAILHGQVPLPEEPFSTLDAQVFVSAGKTDRLIPYDESEKLAKQLQEAKATVEFFTHPGGHQITREEVTSLKKFFTY